MFTPDDETLFVAVRIPGEADSAAMEFDVRGARDALA